MKDNKADTPKSQQTIHIQQRMIQFIKSMSGQANVLSIPRLYIELTGDLKAALLLNQCVYWSDRTSRKDGYFYKTYAAWEEEIGMSKREVSRASQLLQRRGVLHVRIKRANGSPTCHYRVLFESLVKQLKCILESDKTSLSESDENALSLTETTQILQQRDSPCADAQDVTSEPFSTSEKRKILERLESEFAALTGLPIPRRDNEKDRKYGSVRWGQPLWAMFQYAAYDSDTTISLIHEAIEHLKEKNCDISAPQSIEQTFTLCQSIRNDHEWYVALERLTGRKVNPSDAETFDNIWELKMKGATPAKCAHFSHFHVAKAKDPSEKPTLKTVVENWDRAMAWTRETAI